MHQLSSGIRVKELRTNGIGIIAIVELAVTQKMAWLVGDIVVSSGELETRSDAGGFPTK